MYRRIAEKLYENFVVNKNVAAIQQKELKYFTVKSPITVPLIEEMLRGGYSIGTYQQQTNQNKLRWICFDFDCKHQNKENLITLKREYVDVLATRLEKLQIKYLLEFSGRRGIHVWIFLDQVISKDLAFAIVVKLREPFYKKIISDERFGLDCFPKTGSGKINNKYGLQVALRKYAKFLNDYVNISQVSVKTKFAQFPNLIMPYMVYVPFGVVIKDFFESLKKERYVEEEVTIEELKSEIGICR